jgi:DNA-binding transcriptional regulator LsrR (DeoR family)
MNSFDYLLSEIARLYYIEKIKQKDIAKRFNMTSMMISRYLKEAEDKNIVSFFIKTQHDINYNKGILLREKYAIKDCVVINTEPKDSISTIMASYLASYLSSRLFDNVTLGISCGNTLSKMVNMFPYVDVRNSKVLQLSGMYITDNYDVSPQSIINTLSNKISSQVYSLNAPLYVSTKEIRDQLINDKSNLLLWNLAKKSDINVIGCSGLDSTASTLKRGTISQDDANELISLGSVGDVAGTYISKEGKIQDWSKKDCYTGVPLEIIKNAKDVICVAGEVQKSEVLNVAMENRYFNILITSNDVADKLLEKKKV